MSENSEKSIPKGATLQKDGKHFKRQDEHYAGDRKKKEASKE